MSTPALSHFLGPFPDIFDWLETPRTLARSEACLVPSVEDYIKDSRYVLRAELPGINPSKNLQLTVGRGVLNHQGQQV